jgi:hypothetical protein
MTDGFYHNNHEFHNHQVVKLQMQFILVLMVLNGYANTCQSKVNTVSHIVSAVCWYINESSEVLCGDVPEWQAAWRTDLAVS